MALPAYVIERIAQRRSSAHAFERIDPARTALVVVDLQNGFMAPGQPAEIPVARAIVPNVNRLAEATRKAGGTVVWIKNTFDQEAAQTWTVWRTSFATGDWGQRMEEAFTPGNFGHELYAGLKTAPDDLVVLKRRFSALERFPLGLNRDSQWARKGGVLADDSVSGMHFAAAPDSSCDGCPPKPAPNSSLMQDMLQHDRNPL